MRCFASMNDVDHDTYMRYDAILPIDVARRAVDDDPVLFQQHFEEQSGPGIDIVTHVRPRTDFPTTTPSSSSSSSHTAAGDKPRVDADPRALLAHALEEEWAALHVRILRTWTFHRGMAGLLLPFGAPAPVPHTQRRVAMPPEPARWGLAFVDLTDDGDCYLTTEDSQTGRLQSCVPITVADVAAPVPEPSWHSLFIGTPRRAYVYALRLSSAYPTEELHALVCGVLVRLNPTVTTEEAVCLAVATLLLLCGDNRTMNEAALAACDADRRARRAALFAHPTGIPSREDLFVNPPASRSDRTDVAVAPEERRRALITHLLTGQHVPLRRPPPPRRPSRSTNKRRPPPRVREEEEEPSIEEEDLGDGMPPAPPVTSRRQAKRERSTTASSCPAAVPFKRECAVLRCMNRSHRLLKFLDRIPGAQMLDL